MDRRRQVHRLRRRNQMQRLDGWLSTVESMLENDRRTLPEAMVREIAGYLGGVDPSLRRHLLRNRAREATRVLDVLFDAQEVVRPRPGEVA